MCNKTNQAFDNLISGRADIIFTAAPSQAQVDSARERGVEFRLTPLGKEAFVFFVHRDNAVDGLSQAQLRQIYAGELRNWRDVGGSWSRIIAYQRPEGSGSQSALQRFMGGFHLMEPPADRVAGGMGGMVHRVATYRNFGNALGYTFRYFATDMVQNHDIKLIRVDGVYPAKETICDNSYPLTDTLYAVTTQNAGGNTLKLLEWIRSRQGQELVEKAGYVRFN